jgi:hypothetical protein
MDATADADPSDLSCHHPLDFRMVRADIGSGLLYHPGPAQE